MLAANQPLFTLHAMKEQLRLFWSQGTADRAKSFLLNWCFDALTSGVKQLNAVGSTILASMQGLLGYYPHKITNGPLEGLNNKIKTMKRQAYGFRDWNTSSSDSTTYTTPGTRLPDEPHFGVSLQNSVEIVGYEK